MKLLLAFCLFGTALAILPLDLKTRIEGCKSSDECAGDECCVKDYGGLIASKRDLLIARPGGFVIKASCKKLKVEKQSCGQEMFSCGCGAGLYCKWTMPELPKVLPQRIEKRIPMPGSGQCVKKEN